MTSLSVDPGIRGTGWALWEGKRLRRYGVFSVPGKYEWEEAGHLMAAQVHGLGHKEKVEKVYCEFPAFHQSAGGQVVAKSGSLVKLAWFTGFLSAMFVTEFTSFQFVSVQNWKGQLPKEIVNARIRKILGEKVCCGIKTHAWDAVGIGLYVHGRF